MTNYAVPVKRREGSTFTIDRLVVVEASDPIMAQVVVKRWLRTLDLSANYRDKIGRPTETTEDAEIREKDYPLMSAKARRKLLARQMRQIREAKRAE